MRAGWLKSQWWHNRDILIIAYVLGFLALLAFTVGIWECAAAGSSCVEFGSFKERLSLSDLPDEEKAVYFLYYVTGHINLRHEMTPDVISERMAESGIANVPSDQIRIYFQSRPGEIVSTTRTDSYRVSENKAIEIKEMLDIEGPELLTLRWIWDHFPFQLALPLQPALGRKPAALEHRHRAGDAPKT